MSTITTINGSDKVKDSRSVINTNFANLNADKAETLSDLGVTQSAANINANLPSTAEKAAMAGGGALGTPSGSNKFLTEASLTGTAPIVRTYLTAGSPHTWTKPAGIKYVIVEVQGAGGNGATDGGGGGAGGYSRRLIAETSLGSTVTVTVGSAGIGSGNTSFGSFAIGGNGQNASGGGAGGVSSAGDVNIDGQSGDPSQGGAGGSSFFGMGGVTTYNTSNLAVRNGRNGAGFGAGGGGGQPAADNSPSGGTGGNATQGTVIVTEFY